MRTQKAEIREMEEFDRRLQEAGVAAGDLGVAEQEMGMEGDAQMLLDAKPFDREFIDSGWRAGRGGALATRFTPIT